MAIDLKPYGLNLVLEPAMSEIKSFLKSQIVATAQETKDSFEVAGTFYRKGKLLGEGSYGATFECLDPTGNKVAIKAVKDALYDAESVRDFLMEIIIQIVLMETSKNELNGPFVPRIYKVGYNPVSKKGFIVSELMYRTVKDLIKSEPPEKNNVIVPEMLKQIATILEFFGNKLQFNHRDCKCDNLMYVKDQNGKRVYKIIDFGYSCLKWNALELRGDIPKLAGECFRKGRDMTQLMYELWMYYPLSKELFEWLFSHFQVHVDKICSITKGCDIPSLPVKTWQNTYNLFTTKNVEPVYNTHAVLDRVKLLQQRNEFKTRKNKPAAPKEKIVIRINDHRTNKLVDSLGIKSKTPFKIVFEIFKNDHVWAKDGFLVFKYNGTVIKETDTPLGLGMTSPTDITVATYLNSAAAAAAEARPVAAVPPPAPKQCPPGKILNPKTGRCVNIDGWMGKQIAKGV